MVPRRSSSRPIPWLLCLLALLVTVLALPALGKPHAKNETDPESEAEPEPEPERPLVNITRAMVDMRRDRHPVTALGDGTLICEAEEFHVSSPGNNAWQAAQWGANADADMVGCASLSRGGFLGAPDQCPMTQASARVKVAKGGQYLALVRYEAPYRFNTQFILRIEQHGKTKLDRLYGSTSNPRIYGYGAGLAAQLTRSDRPVDYMAWEGHDALVTLEPGEAYLTLIAQGQPTPAARRNVDVVVLAPSTDALLARIQTPSPTSDALPLDDLLTLTGDLYLRIKNEKYGLPLTPTVMGSDGQHRRELLPHDALAIAPGLTTEWVEVGSLLGSLHLGVLSIQVRPPPPPATDVQGTINAPDLTQLNYTIEAGTRDEGGAITTIAKFKSKERQVQLECDTNVRYSHIVTRVEGGLDDIIAALRHETMPGRAPNLVPVFWNSRFTQTSAPGAFRSADELSRLVGASPLGSLSLQPLYRTLVGPASEGEDIWRWPVGSPQMRGADLDMAHGPLTIVTIDGAAPGNIPSTWRRQFYTTIGRGTHAFSLGDLPIAPPASGLNSTLRTELYNQMRRSLYELGTFEELLAAGQVPPAPVAMWVARTDESFLRPAGTAAAGRRTLYVAIRHQQLPVDMISDAKDLATHRVLYLTDRSVSRAASQAINTWVMHGGRLLATAGAGMLDETGQRNQVLRDLLGVEEIALDAPADAAIVWEKRDLPFSIPIDEVAWADAAGQPPMPVIAVRSRVRVMAADAHAQGHFRDNSPAIIVRAVGNGTTTYAGFLPGLTYFKPAIPQRPLDRGNTTHAMAHFIPTAFDAGAGTLVAAPAMDIARPVWTSQPLVEADLLDSSTGTVVSLINWSDEPVKGLTVRLAIDHADRQASLASGGKIKAESKAGKRNFTFDLDVADALILR